MIVYLSSVTVIFIFCVCMIYGRSGHDSSGASSSVSNESTNGRVLVYFAKEKDRSTDLYENCISGNAGASSL